MAINIQDFYIKDNRTNRYSSDRIIEDDVINVIIQKYLMLIYTNKGEVLGADDMGLDLEEKLNTTFTDSSLIEMDIYKQIGEYIPELDSIPYNVSVKFLQDDSQLINIMAIYFKLSDYEVYTQIIGQ